MNCAEIGSLLTAWMDGELEPDAIAAVEAHVAACDECHCRVTACEELQQVFRGEAGGEGAAADTETDTFPVLWQNIQAQIQAEENAELRREMAQMRQMLRELQAEVSNLRRQVSRQTQREHRRFDVLMPGVVAPKPTMLRSLLG